MRRIVELLVQAERARRVLGVDAEAGLGHASVAQRGERADDQRARDAAPAPPAPRRDAVEPADELALELVLALVDRVDHEARHHVAVPRNLPEARVEVRIAEEPLEVAFDGLSWSQWSRNASSAAKIAR